MFHSIPETVEQRMRELECRDAADRTDGTSQMERLRQIPPETGRFISLCAASTPPGKWIEIGTSGGYSALWLSLACRARQQSLTTYELLAAKVELARETIIQAGVGDVVQLVAGDAREHLSNLKDVSFCFLDVEKELYSDCYEAVVPRMVAGGLLLADNAISHGNELATMFERVFVDARVDAVIVPLGKGVLMCRRL